MFSTTIRRTLRTFVTSPKTQQRLMKGSVVRSFSVLGPRFSEEHTPKLFGEGGKPGAVPSEVEQSTGLERVEILAKLDGIDIFDDEPLTITSFGTKSNPVIVKGIGDHRLVSCSGFPIDSHETVWLNVEKDHEIDRCPECGQVFKMQQVHFGHHGYNTTIPSS